MYLFIRIKEIIYYLVTQIVFKPFLGQIGSKSRIISPHRIVGSKRIFIGKRTVIHDQVFLMTRVEEKSVIEIGNNCQIGARNHFVSANHITIGNNVLTASNVYISDNNHGYEDVTKPIFSQKLNVGGPAIIGDNTWIGENACIIKACIGRNCVIGANSVVTHSIPDYCIAVGAPARVIKHYDVEKGVWIND